MNRQDDIEIYLATTDASAIGQWLSHCLPGFEVTGSKANKHFAQANTEAGDTEILIITNVDRSGYSSVWFKNNITHWDTDLACAQDAFDALECNVRCTAGGWSEGDEDDLWWQVNASGVQQLTWQRKGN